MSSLLDRLRAETKSQHEQMESVFRLPETRADLIHWLGVFLGFLEPLENKITTLLGPSHPLLIDRLKTPWLIEDLRAHGMSDPVIAALPRCEALPSLASPAHAAGALYVFEGSTLGGQFISRHLESKLGLKDGVGYRYFRSYGADVGLRWQEFRAWMLKHSSANTDDVIIQSADETFARLRSWSTSRQ